MTQPKKLRGLYEDYPKSDNLCRHLEILLTGHDQDLKSIAARINSTPKEILKYLNPKSPPDSIPRSFISAIYEYTHCDIRAINTLAYPKQEAHLEDPSKINCVKFDDDTKSTIRSALKDERNHELFSDVKQCIDLPATTDIQVRNIFHAIVQLCTSMPSYQLLKVDESEQRLDNYENPDSKDSEKVKQEKKLRMLLEKAQRAHFFLHDYNMARKLYLRIIRYNPTSIESHVACLCLLSIQHSGNSWHLELGNTVEENRILQKLTANSVWESICDIFDHALCDPDEPKKRSRSCSAKKIYKKNQ